MMKSVLSTLLRFSLTLDYFFVKSIYEIRAIPVKICEEGGLLRETAQGINLIFKGEKRKIRFQEKKTRNHCHSDAS